jgi:hypothetical protein
MGRARKKKLKVARRGLYSTAALYIADCALAPNNVVPSFISRGATKQRGSPLLAKEETFRRNLAHKS